MNYKDIIFYDYETGGKNPHTCQPIELAAAVIDGRRLEVREDECFSSYIKPLDDEEAIAHGLEPVSEEALKITKIDREVLKTAPDYKTVWGQFELFADKFSKKKGDPWSAPIGAGFNNDGYDAIINNRAAGGHYWYLTSEQKKILNVKEPYGFGPWDDERKQCKIFHKIIAIDLMDVVWTWWENQVGMDNISMDNTRKELGIDGKHAHRGICDVIQGAYVLARFLRLQRKMVPKVKFRNSFTQEDNDNITRIVSKYV
jgi:DNA polymerase III epsilon subunit-like protein